MLAHYLAANVGFKVALHIFQKAVWWPLIFHPKPYYLQSGPYKVALINHNACIIEGQTRRVTAYLVLVLTPVRIFKNKPRTEGFRHYRIRKL